ncbi:MAG: hypothetical protein HEP71_07940 [Roseivirga sp.]|nr:hypothetical protein [Roseivirga sp.]
MASFYKTLFKLRIKHSYYNSGYCNDFSIVPLPHTEKLAKQYKLLFRIVENGMDVLSLMTGDNTPLHDLANDNKLSFALILNNSSLLNFSSLPKKTNSRQLYQIENQEAFGNTFTLNEWDIVDPKPARFTYDRQSAANEISLKSIGPFGDSETRNMIKDGSRFTSTFDLGNRPEGKYLLTATEDGQEKEAYAVYASEELWKTRPFALMDIFTSQLDYNNVKTYYIRLAGKRIVWTYRVNLGKDYSGSDISIEDSRENPEVLFKMVGNTNQASGKTLTFKSYRADIPDKRARIRFKQTPINDFNLIIEKNGTKTEIKGLPNPPIDQVKTEMHINI